jgi:hypothetical protein
MMLGEKRIYVKLLKCARSARTSIEEGPTLETGADLVSIHGRDLGKIVQLGREVTNTGRRENWVEIKMIFLGRNKDS